jgi:ubiquinone/menaquinone biosynthesis C-methylase UbiE
MTRPDHITSTRAVYDFSADQYARAVGTTVTAAFERPIDRAILNAFAEDLVGVNDARVLDVGCGVGRVTSYLHGRGLDVRGIDLSSGMIATARSAHPHLTFDVALMTELPVDHGSVAAAVLWYSIIHTPPALLPEVWNELARVLTPNGRVLVGFQSGNNEEVKRDNDHGSSTTMTWYRHNIDDVARSVEQAGFVIHMRVWRVAELAHETTPQAFLTFQRQSVRRVAP